MHTADKTLNIRAPIDTPIQEHDFETKQCLIVQETFRHKLKKSGCSLKKKSVAVNQDRADRYLFI